MIPARGGPGAGERIRRFTHLSASRLLAERERMNLEAAFAARHRMQAGRNAAKRVLKKVADEFSAGRWRIRRRRVRPARYFRGVGRRRVLRGGWSARVRRPGAWSRYRSVSGNGLHDRIRPPYGRFLWPVLNCPDSSRHRFVIQIFPFVSRSLLRQHTRSISC